MPHKSEDRSELTALRPSRTRAPKRQPQGETLLGRSPAPGRTWRNDKFGGTSTDPIERISRHGPSLGRLWHSFTQPERLLGILLAIVLGALVSCRCSS